MKKIVFAGIFFIALLVLWTNKDFLFSSRNPESKISAQKTDLLLPDLVIRRPEDLYVETGQERKIRFDTSFINQGEGPLEILGETDPDKQITAATQIINRPDGNKVEKFLGNFIFHPTHDHWHIEKFLLFELYTVTPDGKAGEFLKSTEKLSFCLQDIEPALPDLQSAPARPQYEDCDKDIQGLSIGWLDRYRAWVDGQELDISDIADGTYLIRSTINPDKKIQESDYENNQNEMIIEIRDNKTIPQTTKVSLGYLVKRFLIKFQRSG